MESTCKLVIIHSGKFASDQYTLEKVCKAPKLLKNGNWQPEDIKNPMQFGLGCNKVPFNIVITKNGKSHEFGNLPSAFGDFPEAYHILLEGNSDFFDRFNNIYTLNQRNTLMKFLKEYVSNGFTISGAYEHDASSNSPGFLINELLTEPLH